MSDSETEKPGPGPAAAGGQEPPPARRYRRAPIGRMLLRAVVILLAITMLGMWQVARSGPKAAVGSGKALTISLVGRAEFGRAEVYLGDEPSGSPLADETALVEAIRAAAAEGRTEVLVRAAGDVPYGEVLRVYEAALRAVPATGGVRVRLVLSGPSR